MLIRAAELRAAAASSSLSAKPAPAGAVESWLAAPKAAEPLPVCAPKAPRRIEMTGKEKRQAHQLSRMVKREERRMALEARRRASQRSLREGLDEEWSQAWDVAMAEFMAAIRRIAGEHIEWARQQELEELGVCDG